MSDVNWRPKNGKVVRRDAVEEPKKKVKADAPVKKAKADVPVKKAKPKADVPVKKAKPKADVPEKKVKRGVVEMPSSTKGDPDARARKRKQLKDKVAKTSEVTKAAVEKAKKLKSQDKDEKKTKRVKEPLVVLWENDEGTARVVATVNPAHDKYPEMLNVRRQYRRKDETDWSFTRDGFSLPNPNRKMTQRIADGLSELAGMIK